MTKFTFVGLAEFKVALKSLPDTLATEAGDIIREEAEGAGQAVRSAYNRHRVTGSLENHVVVKKKRSGKYGPAYQVASTAPHATIFEKGTQVRSYVTKKNGVKKLVGAMPAAKIFGPVMERHRRFMWDGLYTLLVKHGLLVSGAA